MRHFVLVVCVCLASVSGSVSAADWPCWRGPNHDGISTEKGWKTRWPTPPKQLWETEVGTGFASMSVAKGKLYTAGYNGGQDTIYCLDAVKGTKLWSHSYSCALVDNLHDGGPAATPTVDGNLVYTLSKEGHLFCFGADKGDVRWSHRVQDLLGVAMPQWGFSCSPLVLGEMLIVEAGRTVAFNKLTGEVIWQTGIYEPGYGSPTPFTYRGESVVAVLNNDHLLVLRTKDGSRIANHPWQTDYATSACTPIVSGDTIFISTGYGRGCALLKLVGDNLEVVYENRNMSTHMNTCVLIGGHLYGFTGNTTSRRLAALTCLNLATGEVKWQQRGAGVGSLMAAGNELITMGDDGELALVEASPARFQVTAQARVLEGTCWTVPVLSDGRIYCRNSTGRLVCLDVRR